MTRFTTDRQNKNLRADCIRWHKTIAHIRHIHIKRETKTPQLQYATARRLLHEGKTASGRVGAGKRAGNLEAAFDQPLPHALRVVLVAHAAQEAHAIRAIRRDRILVDGSVIQVSAFPSAPFTHPSKQSMEST